MHSEFYQISQEAADIINQTKAEGGRVICVGTTSCRTIESAAGPDGRLKAGSGWTDIFIYPGYSFRLMDGLITNFHLPESTLVMLVSAFAGREHTLAAYQEAIRERYRFFSFGDAMLILAHPSQSQPDGKHFPANREGRLPVREFSPASGIGVQEEFL